MELKDEEIKQALEEELKTALTINHRFEESNDTENPDDHRFIALLSRTIDLINRQQVEIEQLKSLCTSKDVIVKAQEAEIERLKGWQDLLKAEKHSIIKAEAIKEFAEKVVNKLDAMHDMVNLNQKVVVTDAIITVKKIAKEMAGEQDA